MVCFNKRGHLGSQQGVWSLECCVECDRYGETAVWGGEEEGEQRRGRKVQKRREGGREGWWSKERGMRGREEKREGEREEGEKGDVHNI